MNSQKIIESPHYHLWTDALHACALARQANNKWDRGTYVRWTVTTSWTVLEIACQDALNEPNISYSFRKHLDEAIRKQDFDKLEWSSKIWNRVSTLLSRRKGYMHQFISEGNLFPNASIANESIGIVREAVIAIYQHVNSPAPIWIQDNNDRGWDTDEGSGSECYVVNQGADENDPDVIKICYLHLGEEKLAEVWPSGTDYQPYVEKLIQKIRVPISAIKVYKGNVLVYEIKLNMRGA